MHWDRSIWVHIEQSCLNHVNHLISSGSIDGDLEVRDDDPKVPPEAEREFEP